MTEKTYTFRKRFRAWSLASTLDEELKAALIEQCLSRGYIPFEPDVVRYVDERGRDLKEAQTFGAYAGKKTARIIGVQKRPTVSRIYLPTP